jgi:type IV pilus assembly protein PilA
MPIRQRKEPDGFTLIELMIVVAIIGILAAIAIPNFMAYQGKSRQSEAKINLGSIFTSATSYFAENGTYTVTSPLQLGFIISGTPRYSFYYGTMRINNGTSVGSTCHGANTPVNIAISVGAFTAGAIGDIDGESTTCDQWTIDNARNLSNTVNDVTS